jgi:hypothetical protein
LNREGDSHVFSTAFLHPRLGFRIPCGIYLQESVTSKGELIMTEETVLTIVKYALLFGGSFFVIALADKKFHFV